MKTTHILGITASAVLGTLLLGGGAFAAGVNLGQSHDLQQMVQQRTATHDERGGDQKGQKERMLHRFGHESTEHPRPERNSDHSEQRRGPFAHEHGFDHPGPGHHSSTPELDSSPLS